MNDATVELHGPGVWGKLSGINGEHLLHLVIIVLLGMVIFLLITNDRDRDVQMTSIAHSQQAILSNQAVMIAQLKLDSLETASITYVLTLDERERKSLRLNMPDSLRAKAHMGQTRP